MQRMYLTSLPNIFQLPEAVFFQSAHFPFRLPSLHFTRNGATAPLHVSTSMGSKQYLSALENASRTGIHMFLEICEGKLPDPIPAHAWRLSCNLCHLVSQVLLMHRFYPGSSRPPPGRMISEIAQRLLRGQRLRACMAIGWQLGGPCSRLFWFTICGCVAEGNQHHGWRGDISRGSEFQPTCVLRLPCCGRCLLLLPSLFFSLILLVVSL